MRNECRKTKELISGYVDGNLGPRERTLVAEHVLLCDGCREELERTKLLVAELRGLSGEQVCRDLWPGVASRIATRPAEHKWGFRSALGWGVLTIPAAAAAAIIFFTMKAPEPQKPAPAPAQQMASAEYQAYVQAYSMFRSTQPLSDRATIPAATQLQRLEAVPR
jgi:anti-sigma factor RsiW